MHKPKDKPKINEPCSDARNLGITVQSNLKPGLYTLNANCVQS